jgi:hypothetical protein
LAHLTAAFNKVDEHMLFNADNIITKTIIYIYSMESFVYKELNKASRLQDMSKVPTLGPFSVLLGQIVYGCESRRVRGDTIGKNLALSKK